MEIKCTNKCSLGYRPTNLIFNRKIWKTITLFCVWVIWPENGCSYSICDMPNANINCIHNLSNNDDSFQILLPKKKNNTVNTFAKNSNNY